ncbi:MAG TPA: NYN domain-containing protein [Chloroflexota bacterium]|nr:NYN domain-containing protein [Chloroflexota bacterium]
MPRDEENFVGLFIDWDNLAISTAVDFGGALPDVRAIVKAAQRSGTILVARAYAEWNATSDRLAVYRAGVEPIYAPTFRFEPEPGSQTRGKSLADPCLVTDCIDLLHTMPVINTFVLVSGDKDLIPIVRLVQLRGKRVVVIGPDFVAAILREMADEYIPYRILAETSDTPPSTEVSAYGPRSQRRHQNGSSNSGRGSSSQRGSLSQSRVAARVAQSESNGNGNGSAGLETVPVARVEVARVETPKAEPPRYEPARVEPVRVEPPVVEPVAPEAALPAPIAPEELRDTAPLFDLISSILREREQAGKPRLRATNLKDQLLARVSGFNERKYGFARFKDLLAAAEKAGVLTVSRTGPVQWVTAAPSAPQPAAPTVPEAPPVAVPIAATPAEASPAEELDVDVVRYLLDLRERSRWLTYTYLMTNMVNHLGKGTADADAAVRATLNRLVQSGVLVVDKEPREIDVNGVKHRVKMCHLVDEHPLVAELQAEKTAAEANAEMAPAETIEAAEAVTAPTIENPPAAVEAVGEEPNAPVETVAEPPVEAPSAEAPVVAVSEVPNGAPESPAEANPPESATAPSVAEATTVPAPSEVIEEASASVAEEKSGNGNASAPLTLEDSYAILREVVRDATGPSRPSTGPAAVKNRLVRRLGSFDERAFGFSKFKDYLLAAERAGAIHVEVAGTSARVSLLEPQPEAPAASSAEPAEESPQSDAVSVE